MSKDYYKILGVEKSASKDDLKRAFRKLAHEHHPDKKGGNEAKFKEINEAYQILGDDQKRQQYDQFGATFDGAGGFGAGNQGFGGGNMHFEDLGDLFGDFFGGFGGGNSRGAQTGQDIEVSISLTFEESVFGVKKEITITKNNTCSHCSGTGGEAGSKMNTCHTCSGNGYTVRTQNTMFGAIQSRIVCTKCQGAGSIPEKVCTTCKGAGLEYTRKAIQVDIPAGVEHGNRMRMRGQGEAIKGGQAGDLYIQLRVAEDKRFIRERDNIYSHVSIGFSQAALGDEIQADTVDGKVKLHIPAGTQSGERLRLKSKGVPHGHGRGDHIVIIQVATPKKLTREQKRLLEELHLKM